MARNKIIPYDQRMKFIARKLRKNMTLSEILLWKQIRCRKLGVQFHRQVPIDRFVVDFYCHEIMLAIEIDGITHDNPQSDASDKERQQILETYGVKFIRIPDKEVKRNLDGILRLLEAKVRKMLE
ncbi:MAG TPA: endonuclease domain-containing protein [Gracilimonas sp.]|uniref:endonuclease domain-containing protein n=1 Tax=Gracilimonas sp. TaxID=1974203 RepID=UPI002DA8B2E2|nr:endonuclease domain-containing protein [Gracilimonas sp.]